jgi:phenylpropionate dioxygenase-like ring-hydroxylating dioxygenase large terminal subunit
MIADPILIDDWHPVARSADLVEGAVKAARLLGQDLVIWRNAEGVHAWFDLCVHRGAKLSNGRVAADCLVCPYHGWNYGSDGHCVRIPAHPGQTPPVRAQATTYLAQERYGLIWVCLGTPAKDIAPYPEWDDPAYRHVPSGPYRFKALGPRVIENFLDVGHFPFVHAGYLGDPAHTEIEDYQVETTADGVIARDIAVWQPDPDGTGKSAKVRYTYEALRPLMARFTKFQGEHRFTMLDVVTPVSDQESIAWAIMSMNYAFDVPYQQLVDFQDAVTAQDLPVVESQRPELLPLDLQAELHLRSDRTAIAYRQWLRRIGLKYGTS